VVCLSQDNPSSISSNGVPPALMILGCRDLSDVQVRPVHLAGWTGRRREFAGEDRL